MSNHTSQLSGSSGGYFKDPDNIPTASFPDNEAERQVCCDEFWEIASPVWLEEHGEELVKEIKETFKVDGVAIILDYYNHKVHYVAQTGYGSKRSAARKEVLAAHMLGCDESGHVIEDATKDPRFFNHPQVINAPWIRFFCVVPLKTPTQEIFGTLEIWDARPRTITIDEEEKLLQFATQILSSVEPSEGWHGLRRLSLDNSDRSSSPISSHFKDDFAEPSLIPRALSTPRLLQQSQMASETSASENEPQQQRFSRYSVFTTHMVRYPPSRRLPSPPTRMPPLPPESFEQNVNPKNLVGIVKPGEDEYSTRKRLFEFPDLIPRALHMGRGVEFAKRSGHQPLPQGSDSLDVDETLKPANKNDGRKGTVPLAMRGSSSPSRNVNLGRNHKQIKSKEKFPETHAFEPKRVEGKNSIEEELANPNITTARRLVLEHMLRGINATTAAREARKNGSAPPIILPEQTSSQGESKFNSLDAYFKQKAAMEAVELDPPPFLRSSSPFPRNQSAQDHRLQGSYGERNNRTSPNKDYPSKAIGHRNQMRTGGHHLERAPLTPQTFQLDNWTPAPVDKADIYRNELSEPGSSSITMDQFRSMFSPQGSPTICGDLENYSSDFPSASAFLPPPRGRFDKFDTVSSDSSRGKNSSNTTLRRQYAELGQGEHFPNMHPRNQPSRPESRPLYRNLTAPVPPTQAFEVYPDTSRNVEPHRVPAGIFSKITRIVPKKTGAEKQAAKEARKAEKEARRPRTAEELAAIEAEREAIRIRERDENHARRDEERRREMLRNKEMALREAAIQGSYSRDKEMKEARARSAT